MTQALEAPNDEALLADELTLDGSADEQSCAIIACGALAREILAILDQQGLRGRVALACLPALLHNRPEKIPEAVREKAKTLRESGVTKVLVAYADCGTGGMLDKVCEEEGLERIAGPHCYAFFSGSDTFAANSDSDMTSFYLTDFLARQFEAIIWRGLGLDRHPELRDMYFAHYEKLVYLAQTDDPKHDAAARSAAEKLGLVYERRFTGYGELADFVQRADQRA